MNKNSAVIGSGSVRSVRMLGSTTTATVCNSQNTGNIVVIAAGGKGGKKLGFSIRCRNNVAPVAGSSLKLTDAGACFGVVSRTHTGIKLGPLSPRGSVVRPCCSG